MSILSLLLSGLLQQAQCLSSGGVGAFIDCKFSGAMRLTVRDGVSSQRDYKTVTRLTALAAA
jgi:hypothetical protein